MTQQPILKVGHWLAVYLCGQISAHAKCKALPCCYSGVGRGAVYRTAWCQHNRLVEGSSTPMLSLIDQCHGGWTLWLTAAKGFIYCCHSSSWYIDLLGKLHLQVQIPSRTDQDQSCQSNHCQLGMLHSCTTSTSTCRTAVTTLRRCRQPLISCSRIQQLS